jgi:hypothetical protein
MRNSVSLALSINQKFRASFGAEAVAACFRLGGETTRQGQSW